MTVYIGEWTTHTFTIIASLGPPVSPPPPHPSTDCQSSLSLGDREMRCECEQKPQNIHLNLVRETDWWPCCRVVTVLFVDRPPKKAHNGLAYCEFQLHTLIVIELLLSWCTVHRVFLPGYPPALLILIRWLLCCLPKLQLNDDDDESQWLSVLPQVESQRGDILIHT